MKQIKWRASDGLLPEGDMLLRQWLREKSFHYAGAGTSIENDRAMFHDHLGSISFTSDDGLLIHISVDHESQSGKPQLKVELWQADEGEEKKSAA